MKRITLYLTILGLNLFDYAVTVYWTKLYGVAVEINPLMRGALAEPLVFAVVKLILFPLFLGGVYTKNHDDTAWMALGMFIVVTLMNIRTVFGL